MMPAGRRRRGRGIIGAATAMVLAAAAAPLALGSAAAETAEPAATAASIADFMVQNVCLNGAGEVLIGRSPVDDDPGDCAAQRDLRPGERLPYHKHDHAALADRRSTPDGYQRHDSFPVATAGPLGVVVEHSFDFGNDGRRFGVFDEASDGGDVTVLAPDAVSIVATRDVHGFEFWVGQCRGQVTAAALAHSWLVAAFDPQRRDVLLSGETIARLNEVPAVQSAACPSRFNPAFTRWRIVPFRYRAAPGQGTPVTLLTLLSEHYGGADPATADHVERFYFTRELGGTRWERWQNAAGDREFSPAVIAERAAAIAASGRCSAAPPPAGGAPMRLIDCREWTQIVAPGDPVGDPPGFFLTVMRRRPDAPALFAAPAEPK